MTLSASASGGASGAPGGAPARAGHLLIRLANSRKGLISLLGLVVLFGAISHMVLEKSTFGDGLWWSIVTSSTVGYGDIAPKSLPGRLVAGFIIYATFLLLVPLVTAQLASKLVQDADQFSHEEQEELKAAVDDLQRELAEQRRLLEQLVERTEPR